ncbi:hypothetical protein ISS42_02210, partial [Candidatus Shapirobacteria bacterium]|nr:hypothetical protein [Candidatus Shapirobacteria bacterium]
MAISIFTNLTKHFNIFIFYLVIKGKNIFKFLLAFIFYLLCLPHLLFPEAQAQNVFLFDDFDLNRETWLELSQSWNIIQDEGNGVLHTTFLATDTRALITPDIQEAQSWDNYSLETSLKSLNGVDQMIWFRFQENSGNYNYYSVNLRASGWIDSNNIRV